MGHTQRPSSGPMSIDVGRQHAIEAKPRYRSYHAGVAATQRTGTECHVNGHGTTIMRIFPALWLYFFSGKLHLEAKYRGEYHLYIFPK